MEPAASEGDGGLRRIRLDLGYDGTGFAGWAAQPGLRTVQGVLEASLGTVLRLPEPPRTAVAGRTDAGVHARGQVCHVDVPTPAWQALPGRSTRTPAAALQQRLARLLPADVRVAAVSEAAPGFDARFSATSRRYAYRLSDSPAGPEPLLRGWVVHHNRPLDVPAMHAAAGRLIGEHDFAAFCRRRAGATTIRTLLSFGWRREHDLVVADVAGDAFCHSQVRALVGACLAVGEARRPPGWPAAVLAAGRRDSSVLVAAARGLVLEHVAYPADDRLAARAAETRRIRALHD